MQLPKQGVWFLVNVTDSYNFTVTGNITVRVIPAGIPQFLGITAVPASGLYHTGGGELVIVNGAYFTSSVVTARYYRADLGLSFNTTVSSRY